MYTRDLRIIICSYGRFELLRTCLDSLVGQDGPVKDRFDVLVVNNHNSDEARKALADIMSNYDGWTWADEPKTGLSHARNRGLSLTPYPWIGFVDDDARLDREYIAIALNAIRENKFDCLGGKIISSWPYGRPHWLSPEFGTKPNISSEVSPLENAYLWGSNMIFRTELLRLTGGFPVNTGMAGKKIGYAAENIVQDHLRRLGGSIGYHPDLTVYHAVLPDKHRLSWHLRASYAEGRDGKSVFPEHYTWSGIMKTIKLALLAPFKACFERISKSDYYYQNLILDVLKPWYLVSGRIRAILR